MGKSFKLTKTIRFTRELVDKDLNILKNREVFTLLILHFNNQIEKTSSIDNGYKISDEIKIDLEQSLLDHYNNNRGLSDLDIKEMDVFYVISIIPYIIIERGYFKELDELVIKKLFSIAISINFEFMRLGMKKTIKPMWRDQIFNCVNRKYSGKLDDINKKSKQHYELNALGLYFSFRTASYTQIPWHATVDKIGRIIGKYVFPRLAKKFH